MAVRLREHDAEAVGDRDGVAVGPEGVGLEEKVAEAVQVEGEAVLEAVREAVGDEDGVVVGLCEGVHVDVVVWDQLPLPHLLMLCVGLRLPECMALSVRVPVMDTLFLDSEGL